MERGPIKLKSGTKSEGAGQQAVPPPPFLVRHRRLLAARRWIIGTDARRYSTRILQL